VLIVVQLFPIRVTVNNQAHYRIANYHHLTLKKTCDEKGPRQLEAAHHDGIAYQTPHRPVTNIILIPGQPDRHPKAEVFRRNHFSKRQIFGRQNSGFVYLLVRNIFPLRCHDHL